ncbi:phiSA1p31-related protein [Streptomyces sp. R44]|uniref:PhiSA1p31-related protein n=1 Tax=Streptomyces sp. R44 TaxID=3238633 RepID=A0AB39T5P2_9ACTN
MAHAQYETRTRTVEETVVVLEISENDADELRAIVGAADGTRAMVRVFQALEAIGAPMKSETYATGSTYELNAKYRDRSGDVWEFTGKRSQSGEPYVTYTGFMDNEDTISEIEREWGPLVKVTE